MDKPTPMGPRQARRFAELEAIGDRLAAGEIDEAEANRQSDTVLAHTHADIAADVDEMLAARAAAERRRGLVMLAIALAVAVASVVLLQ